MFTADGLRPDSPHLAPPRGAASVLSLSPCLCLAPSTSRLSPTPARHLSRSLFRPLARALSVPRTRHSHDHAPSLLVAPAAPRALLSPRASSRLSCGQCKGGESGPRESERELATERKVSAEGERAIRGCRDQDGDERSRAYTCPTAHGRDGDLYARALLMAGGGTPRAEYRPLVSLSLAHRPRLRCSLAPSLSRHRSNLVSLTYDYPSHPRRFRSILIYEGTHAPASSFLQPSLSLSSTTPSTSRILSFASLPPLPPPLLASRSLSLSVSRWQARALTRMATVT